MNQLAPRRTQPPPLPQAMPAGGYGVPTAAPGHVPMLLTVVSYGKGAILVLLTIIVLEIFGGVTGFYPSKSLGTFFGRISGAEMESRQAAEAAYRQGVAEAEARVQRQTLAYQAQLAWMTSAYENAYERLNIVTTKAVEIEQDYLRELAQTQQAGQAGSNMMATGFDLACGIAVFAGDRGSANRFCGQGQQLRNSNVREIERTVKANAGQITRQVMDGLPDPGDLATQLQRVAATSIPPAGQ